VFIVWLADVVKFFVKFSLVNVPFSNNIAWLENGLGINSTGKHKTIIMKSMSIINKFILYIVTYFLIGQTQRIFGIFFLQSVFKTLDNIKQREV
jgi:hypothetical protein